MPGCQGQGAKGARRDCCWCDRHCSGCAAQTGSVTGVVTATAKGLAPVRVTIDQKVCGSELPDQAVVVDAQGHLAYAVVTLAGVKAKPGAGRSDVSTNEKCAFGPRVQIARPNANVRTTSKDPILHTTNASTENGRTLFNVALPIPGINIVKPIGPAGSGPPELQHASVDARLGDRDRRGRRGHRPPMDDSRSPTCRPAPTSCACGTRR